MAGRTRQDVNYSMHARIRAGDPEAFRELFRDYAQLVYRHAVRSTGNWAAAEDVVALTFLEAWRLREKLRDEGETPRPWLMGIAVNVLRNTGRAARRHDRALTRLPLRDVLPDFADELVGRIADSEELAAAKVALGKLRRSECEVFALCVWSGLGYAEAAEALGVPVGTVRSRLSRARVRLRKLTDGELRSSRKGAEPVVLRGQVQGDRIAAVRSNEESGR